MRNLCKECETCPDRTNSMRQCFEECGYPLDILMEKERERNSRKGKQVENEQQR